MSRLFARVVWLAVPLVYFPASGQEMPSDSASVDLPELTIEAVRGTLAEADAPMALSILSGSSLQTRTGPVSLSETLARLPGAQFSDRSNMALGERLTIRGQGWRSQFGVRGVAVLLDGVPLSMPDGQSVLDIVDPSLITRAELLRGPSSSLWGNASGGVLYLSSRREDVDRSVLLDAAAGSFDTRRLGVRATAGTGRSQTSVAVSNMQTTGYRAYSAGRMTRASLVGGMSLNGGLELDYFGAMIDADVEHPGALTSAELETDRRGADQRNVNTASGKESRQAQAGVSLQRVGLRSLSRASVFGVVRHLENPLPFAYIQLRRAAQGARVEYHRHVRRARLTVAYDGSLQRDDRENWNNDRGSPGDTQRLAQVERVASHGAATNATLPLGQTTIVLGARLDAIRFSNSDGLLTDGDQSGSRWMSAISPMVGVSHTLRPLTATHGQLFANLTTAFETPTTTELVNRPDLRGGFNPGLDPQRTVGGEIGGKLEANVITASLVAYTLSVSDRISPFQTEAGEGRTFFRNLGSTRHRGIEATAAVQIRRATRADLIATIGAHTIDDSDLVVPGVPGHRALVTVTHKAGPLAASVQVESVGRQFADEANTAEIDGVTLAHVTLSSKWAIGPTEATPYLSIRNVTDAAYIGSVVVNARGARYYEPSPGRTWRFGVRLAL